MSRRHEKRTGELFYYSRHPGLHLKGHWLKELGFDTGQKIEVLAEPGLLIVRLAQER